jgi:HSP20 family protein
VFGPPLRGAGEFAGARMHRRMPAIDLEHENGNLVLRADIPGIKPEQVKIEIADDTLTVSGEHEESRYTKDKQFVRRERHYGSFSRSISLPPGVDATKVAAKTHDGLLEVTIPLPAQTSREPVSLTPTAV